MNIHTLGARLKSPYSEVLTRVVSHLRGQEPSSDFWLGTSAVPIWYLRRGGAAGEPGAHLGWIFPHQLWQSEHVLRSLLR